MFTANSEHGFPAYEVHKALAFLSHEGTVEGAQCDDRSHLVKAHDAFAIIIRVIPLLGIMTSPVLRRVIRTRAKLQGA